MSGREWDEQTASYVDAFAADVDVDVDVDAAWARFEAEVEPSRRPRAALLWGAGAAALVAALLVAWVAMPASKVESASESGGLQARDEARADEARVAPLAEPEPRAPRPRVAEPLVTPPPPREGQPETESAPVDTGGATSAAAPKRQAKAGETAVEAPRSSSLAEELRLLEALRRASAAGRHQEVLSLVSEHARRFPDGSSFAAERELARVRALCGLGRSEALRKAKARFAASFPASHLGSLVRDTCAPTENSDHDG